MPPIYTFLCGACGHEFDETSAYDPDNRPIECPHECGSTATRIPSRPAQARGSFGTVPKRSATSRVRFNFKTKEDE